MRAALDKLLPVFKDCLRLGHSCIRPATPMQKAATIVTACMFAAGVTVYVAVCYSYKYGGLPDFIGTGIFSIYDGGMMEVVGYIMMAVTMILLVNVMISEKQKQWLPFLAILFLVFNDDMYQFHSVLGMYFETIYGMENYSSELLAFMCIGIFVPALWAWGLYLCPKENGELETYLVFSAYFSLLVFFGVFFDAFDIYMVIHYDVSETLLGLIEEGGETGIMCLMALTALGTRQAATINRIENV